MSQDLGNYDVPIELVFDITKTSLQMRFLGLSEKPEESGNELTGLFDWTCQACRAANRDTVVLKPQGVFFAKWTCSTCSRVTLVRFRARAVAEWVAQHTAAVTGKPVDVPVQDKRAPYASNRARSPRDKRQAILGWVVIPVLAVVIVLGWFDMRRVSRSLASPRGEVDAPASRTRHESSASTPSSRIVGYWVSEQRDHVMHFDPIEPTVGEGTYTVVSRGDKNVETVHFKVLHEETAGEQLVIRKDGEPRERLVIQHNGAEITYRLQAESMEVTLNVAKDAKSMTRLEIRGGQPALTCYFNAAEAANR
ncbi:MAG: hypothetical protein JW955_20755 [Sedimentisphaerales bacterium]|nr:hypothetical protein [Sedimentisphaerales bacterium]